MKRKSGFTLMELMVAVTLMVMLIGAVVLVFVKSTDVFTGAEARMQVYGNARASFQLLGRELASAATGDSGVTFTTTTGTTDTNLLQFTTTTTWLDNKDDPPSGDENDPSTPRRITGTAVVTYGLQEDSKKRVSLTRQIAPVDNTGPFGPEVVCQYLAVESGKAKFRAEFYNPDPPLNDTAGWKDTKEEFIGPETGANGYGPSYEFESGAKLPNAVRITMDLLDEQKRETRTLSRVFWIATGG